MIAMETRVKNADNWDEQRADIGSSGDQSENANRDTFSSTVTSQSEHAYIGL